MESIELLRLLDEIKKLSSQIEDLKANQIKPKQARRSEQIHELATALAKAQGEMKVAGKDKENPYFKSKYADWESVVNASRPALTKYGLSVDMDLTSEDDGATYLHCTLLHTSGQFVESRVRFTPPKADIQSMASYNTSLKRLVYSNLVGVVVGDEDDDGEAAVATTRETFAKGTALNHKYNPVKEMPDVITKEQLEELNYELAEYPDICELVLDGLKIQNLADMPKTKYMASVNRIREIKNLRNGNK